MTLTTGSTLVVGGDSTVGKTLCEYFREAKQPVCWTTRRPVPDPGADCFALDLSRIADQWLPPANVNSAVLCAAVTRIDICRKDPNATARINVEGTVRVAQRLVEQGIFTVFLSTNQVFDGERAFPGADEPTTPRSIYGRQKAEAETQLLELGPLVAVVRCTKILGSGFPLFAQWLIALKNQTPIEPFSDMVMAPVPLSYVVAVIRLLIDRRIGGIYHISGNRDVSYADIALRAAHQLGVSSHLVRPVCGKQSGRISEPIPAHTALDVESVRCLWGVDAPPVEWTIDRAFRAA